MNVVIFGESGSGKSSAVNLLLGRQEAAVNDGAVGCTFEFQKYTTEKYNLFDTVGLSEGSKGTVNQAFAVKKLINLLKSLEEGVSLLVFVMEKGRIKASLDENYKLFVEAICMKSVPVVLLVTHCELEQEPKKWWTENKKEFDKYGMNFCAVICGCCMNLDKSPETWRPIIKPQVDSTLKQLNEAIEGKMLSPGWKVEGGWKNWLLTVVHTIKDVFNVLGSFFPIFWIPGLFMKAFVPETPTNDFEGRLYTYFISQKYEPPVARQMAKDIADSF